MPDNWYTQQCKAIRTHRFYLSRNWLVNIQRHRILNYEIFSILFNMYVTHGKRIYKEKLILPIPMINVFPISHTTPISLLIV